MSAPAIAVGLKIVGTVFAAKTAIDGLKEGNILKAVIGGVGAFMGGSSLMSQSAFGETVGNVTGTIGDAADAGTASAFTTAEIGANPVNGLVDAGANVAQVADQSLMPTIMNKSMEGAGSVINNSINGASTPSMVDGALNPMANETNGLLSQFTDGVSQAGTDILDSVKEVVSPYQTATAGNTGGGLLTDAAQLFKDNQGLAGGLAQLYAGSRNQDFIEEQMEENRRREDERRARMGAAPSYIYSFGQSANTGR